MLATFNDFYVDLTGSQWLDTIREKLSRNGLVTFDGIGTKQDLLQLAKALGHIRPHRDSSEDGITEVFSDTKSKNEHSYLGFTSAGLFPHTDSSNVSDPPELLILLCLKPSQQGGESTFVDGQSMYKALKDMYPKLLENLLSPNSALFGGGSNPYLGSVFTHLESGRMSIRFRNDNWGFYSSPVAAKFEVLLNLIEKLSFSFTLSEKQGYVLQNRRWLHGRFPYSGSRQMLRILADSDQNPSDGKKIEIGFLGG